MERNELQLFIMAGPVAVEPLAALWAFQMLRIDMLSLFGRDFGRAVGTSAHQQREKLVRVERAMAGHSRIVVIVSRNAVPPMPLPRALFLFSRQPWRASLGVGSTRQAMGQIATS